MNVFLTTVWANPQHPEVVGSLRSAGFVVYDFAVHGPTLAPWWGHDAVTAEQFTTGLADPMQLSSFRRNFEAMQAADVCVLLLPAGRSAHLELGWFVGRGVPTVVVLGDCPPHELAYSLVDCLVPSVDGLVDALHGLSLSVANA